MRMLITLFMLLGLAANAQEPVVEQAPKLVCEQPTYNFGELDNAKEVEHTFVLRNDGDVSLEITKVRPACGCTVASTSHNTVPPGSVTEITTKLSLHGRQGQQRKSITVESNDPKQPQFMLWLEGTAISEVQMRPNQIFFGRITSESVATGVVELVIQGTNPVAITQLTSTVPSLSVTNHSSDGGRMNTIKVTTVPPMPRGTLRGEVLVNTDHPKYPSMNIIVSAFVVNDITYVPDTLMFTEAAGQPVTRYVLIRAEGGRAFEVSSVEAPDPAIKVNIQKTAETAYRLEIANIVVTPELDGKVLLVKTTMPGMEEISIPFRVTLPAEPTPTPSPAPPAPASP